MTCFLLTQYKKAHKRWETLRSCEDYRHTRSYTIYHAIRNVDISLSGSCEYPITTIDLGGWYEVSMSSVRSVSRPTSYMSSPVRGPGRKIGSLIGLQSTHRHV